MPTMPLPEHPSLDQLMGQATLVRDLIRDGDPGGLAMVDEFHPTLVSARLTDRQRRSFGSADAELIIANLYRFSSWAELQDHLAVVESHSFTPNVEREPGRDRPESFVEAACLDYAEAGPSPADRIALAHDMLAADPSVATASIESAAAVGDHRTVAAFLDAEPALIDRSVGPNRWPVLLYATYSRIDTGDPDHSATETVRLLLERGADPNAGFLWRGLVPPFTALTGALGGGESHQPWHGDRLAMAELLLDAGADPNDGQGLYNNGIGGQNHDDPAHLRLLVGHGLGTDRNGPWYRRLGRRLREPAELLYDEVEAAATRDRPTILGYLATLGLDLDRPVGRSQKTPVRIALGQGHQRIVDVLAEAGVDATPTPTERALQHSRDNAVAELRRLLDEDRSLADLLRREHPGLCKNVGPDHDDMLQYLIDLGFDINDRSNTKTALHHAAEGDDPARARLLVDHGADPNLVDTHIGSTPLCWANHFGREAVAGFLRPLTHHGPPLPELTVRHLGTERTLASPALIEQRLDSIHRQGEPVLVTLIADDRALTVGVGHRSLSVALYRDENGTPWHAPGPRSGDAVPDGGEPDRDDVISFATVTDDEDTRFDFDRRLAQSPAAIHRLVSEFVADPSRPPPSAHWVREGGGT